MQEAREAEERAAKEAAEAASKDSAASPASSPKTGGGGRDRAVRECASRNLSAPSVASAASLARCCHIPCECARIVASARVLQRCLASRVRPRVATMRRTGAPAASLDHRPFAALTEGSRAPRATSPRRATSTRVDRPPRAQRARGGKTVTFAEGPGLAGRKLDDLAREAAKALGTGARVESGALVVQGDQSDRLLACSAPARLPQRHRGN
jgi:translation initiation factor 1 (eIF-1/SUI1)